MDNTLKWMHKVQGQQVFRARFSAITAPEIRAAMVQAPLTVCIQDLASRKVPLEVNFNGIKCLLSFKTLSFQYPEVPPCLASNDMNVI